ncbi:MAG: M20/M25/M40 family metallo-hydrolase, partial [Mariprofundaceae bacterium]
MNITPEQLHTLVDAIMPDMINIRRHLHQHPELSGKEKNTALYLADKCRDLGLTVRENIGGFGMRIDIDSGKHDWLALRADMDALPIHDAKSCDYKSTIEGITHACGHDAHSAILLGCIMVLTKLRKQLPSNIA